MKGNSLYARLYLLPIVVFVFLLVLMSILLTNQRGQELQGIQDRLQLQTGLLAEKISSKLNTYEMTLEMIELTAGTIDLDLETEQDFLSRTVRQQLFLHEEIEGVCLISVEGEKLYSSFNTGMEALEQTKQAMLDAHFVQRFPFSLLAYTDHGSKHLVISRGLMDKQRELKALVALVIETERFFNLLDIGLSPGLVSAVLYDHTGEIFAIWNNPNEDRLGRSISVESEHVDELPVYGKYYNPNGDASALQGGSRLYVQEDVLVSLGQTTNFPMTLGVMVHIPTAIGAFDRSIVISLSIVVVIMIIALLIDHQLVKKTKMNDQLHQQMVEELSVQVQQRTAELERMLGKDSLTGIMNRHSCNVEIEKAIETHKNEGIPFCAVGIDLDGFKEVNDTWGHLKGDQILVHITYILSHALGNEGVIARWGGDELLVLLNNCSLANGLVIAERLRQEVEFNPFSEEIYCSISLGVAEHRNGESATTLIDRADTAMYDAKIDGKNCVRPVYRQDVE